MSATAKPACCSVPFLFPFIADLCLRSADVLQPEVCNKRNKGCSNTAVEWLAAVRGNRVGRDRDALQSEVIGRGRDALQSEVGTYVGPKSPALKQYHRGCKGKCSNWPYVFLQDDANSCRAGARGASLVHPENRRGVHP